MSAWLGSCWRGAAMLLVSCVLAACGTAEPAPVIDRRAPASAASRSSGAASASRALPAGWVQVKKGDTLATIAQEHNQDPKDLALWNALDNPNMIRIGQQLRVVPPEGAVAKPIIASAPQQLPAESERSAANANTAALKREPRGGKQVYSEQAWAAVNRPDDKNISRPAPDKKPEAKPDTKPETKPAPAEAAADSVDWVWPANGKIIAPFVEGSHKGIGISGNLGEPVIAAGAGKVLYAGEDLRGYGKLVVLKHNSIFLSVYAHNNQILVKEGQMVAKGEKIAELGKSDSDQPKLHFEIRRQGKPVDPIKFLPPR
jgi:lipoprotein NlpD